MNDSKLKLLVKETVELDRQVQQLTRLLDANKKLLVAEAKARKDAGDKTDGGGLSVIFEGLNGCVARITKAGRTLKGSLAPDSEEYEALSDIVDEAIDGETKRHVIAMLFDEVTSLKLSSEFREIVNRNFSKADAAAILKLVTSSGKTSVSFETKESAP